MKDSAAVVTAARDLAQAYDAEGARLMALVPVYRASIANWAAWAVAFFGWVLGWHATVQGVIAYFGACLGVYYLAGQVIGWRAEWLLREARHLRELHEL